MIESKGWDWNLVKEDNENIWKNPSIESYYLLNRWKSQGKKEFLDLGCGLGRHSILFGKNDTVEWIVLKKDDDSFILLSKYILDVIL